MNIRISIIIPVYNAEKYLSETLDSILNQTFTDFEVIAVNDGSTDSSLDILKLYKNKDKRIRIIDKKNSGVSDARNTGIKNATGEYVCFVDADDILAQEYIEAMFDVVSKYGADMVVCRYVTFRKSNQITYVHGNSDVNQVKSVTDLLERGLLTSAWNKLIKKEIIIKNNILYDTNMTFGEDLFFCWKVYLKSNLIYYLDKELYFYRLMNEGATAKYHPELYENYKRAFNELKVYAQQKNTADSESTKVFDIYFTKRIPSFIKMCIREPVSIRQKYRNMRLILNDSNIQNIFKNSWQELVRNESKRNIKIYESAKKGNINRLFLYCYIEEKKQQLAVILKW